MMYLLSRTSCDRQLALQLVGKKCAIYGCELSASEFSKEGVRRVREITDPDSFSREMLRFMPRPAFDEMFGSPLKRTFALDEVCELYSRVSQ